MSLWSCSTNTFHSLILLWTHLRGRSVSRSSQGPGWCCAVAFGGLAVITSPRCHYQLFRPGLIWLLADILFYHPPTQTQPLKSANNPSSSFPLFSLSWVSQPVPSRATKLQLPHPRALHWSGQKYNFSPLSSVWMRHTWHVTRAKICLCWPGAGDGDIWTMRNESGPHVNTDTWTEF